MHAYLVTMIKMDGLGVEARNVRVEATTTENAKRMVEVLERNSQRDAMGNSGWVFDSAVRLTEPGGSDD